MFRSAASPDPPAPSHVPLTPEERDELLRERPAYWEYLLFASELYLGRAEVEPLWLDHELGVPAGTQRHMDKREGMELLTRTFDSYGRIVGQIDRVLVPEVQTCAFGPPGEPGDPLRLKHLAKAVLDVYQRLMRTAAELRNQGVPSELNDLYEIAARYVDLPLQQIRDFVDTTVRGVNEVIERATGGGTSVESIRLVIELTIPVDQALRAQYEDALARLRASG